jgi:mRNA-degrading endonuclease RelE of RelBE toxin-antitoxin system
MYLFKELPKFGKAFKNFYPKQRDVIIEELKKIQKDPSMGERKKGVLSHIRVHKFKIHHQLYLLAYEPVDKDKTIYLYAIATHENFYKTLQRYTSITFH